MLRKFKTLRCISALLTVLSLALSVYNWNGALSLQYKGTNSIAFGISVGVPVALATTAFIMGLVAWGAIKAIEEENKQRSEEANSEGTL